MTMSRSEKWLVGVLLATFLAGSLVLVSIFFLFRHLAGSFDLPEVSTAAGPPPEVQWEKTFSHYEFSRAVSVLETEDGGYLVASETWFYKDYDDEEEYDEDFNWLEKKIHLVRTDQNGRLVWEKIYDANNTNPSILLVAPAGEGGFTIAGYSTSFPGEGDTGRVFLLIVDSSGEEEQLIFLKPGIELFADTAAPTAEGGFIFVDPIMQEYDEFLEDDWWNPLTPDSEFFIFKTDSSGNIVREGTLSTTDLDRVASFKETADGGLIIIGSKFSNRGGLVLVKIDSRGDMEWEKVFQKGILTTGFAVAESAEGGFVAVGAINAIFGGGTYLLKTDPRGELQWENLVAGQIMEISSINTAPGNSFIAAGSNEGDSILPVGLAAYVFRFDNQGNLLWENHLSKPELFQWDTAVCAVPTSDGGYIITGDYDEGKAFLVKLKTDYAVAP